MLESNYIKTYLMAPVMAACLALPLAMSDSAVANTDTAAVAVLPHGGSSSFLSNLQTGEYKFSNIDQTAVQNFLNSAYMRQNEKDFRTAVRLLDEFDREFQKFLRYFLRDGVGKLKEKSLSGETVTIQDIVELSNAVKTERTALKTKIDGVEAMLAGLPGPAVAAGGQEIPAPNRFDVSGLATVFRNAIDQGIQAFGGNNQVRIVFRTGRVGQCPESERIERSYSIADALNLTFENLPSLICDAELTKMEEQAKNHMKMTDVELERFQSFGEYALIDRIQPYLRECGQEQSWRPTSGSETSVCEKMYRSIYEIFMVRAYIRNIYGVGIGVFGVENYNERTFGLDRFFTTTDVIGNRLTGSFYFSGQSTLGGEGAIATAEKSYQQYVDVARERFTSFVDSDGFVSRVNTLIRMTQNWTEDLAKVNMQILMLLAEDTKQELDVVRDLQGVQQRRAYYESRYYGDELSDDVYNANLDFQCGYQDETCKTGFEAMIGAGAGNSGILGGGFGETSGGLRSEISEVETALNSLIDRFSTAREIIAQVIAQRTIGEKGKVRDEIEDRKGPTRRRRR